MAALKKMPMLPIRGLSPDDWARFLARATSEGWERGPLVKQLMTDYGNGVIGASVAPQCQSRNGRFRCSFAHGHVGAEHAGYDAAGTTACVWSEGEKVIWHG